MAIELSRCLPLSSRTKFARLISIGVFLVGVHSLTSALAKDCLSTVIEEIQAVAQSKYILPNNFEFFSPSTVKNTSQNGEYTQFTNQLKQIGRTILEYVPEQRVVMFVTADPDSAVVPTFLFPKAHTYVVVNPSVPFVMPGLNSLSGNQKINITVTHPDFQRVGRKDWAPGLEKPYRLYQVGERVGMLTRILSRMKINYPLVKIIEVKYFYHTFEAKHLETGNEANYLDRIFGEGHPAMRDSWAQEKSNPTFDEMKWKEVIRKYVRCHGVLTYQITPDSPKQRLVYLQGEFTESEVLHTNGIGPQFQFGFNGDKHLMTTLSSFYSNLDGFIVRSSDGAFHTAPELINYSMEEILHALTHNKGAVVEGRLGFNPEVRKVHGISEYAKTWELLGHSKYSMRTQKKYDSFPFSYEPGLRISFMGD